MNNKINTLHVIKLGGSLMDLDDLRDRFYAWRNTLPEHNQLLVVGGGVSADVVRDTHKKHNLQETVSHRLAIRAMDFNAHVVCAVLGENVAAMATTPAEAQAVWNANKLAIVSPVKWLDNEETRGVTIPHRWSFTSDSISGHVATVLKADQLTLLKSTLSKPSENGQFTRLAAAAQGIVDPDFPAASAQIPHVYIHNLRGNSTAPTRLE